MDLVTLFPEVTGGNNFTQFEIAFVILLVLIAGVAILANRIGHRVPYTIVLVIVGLTLTFHSKKLAFPIPKELILSLLVPPLIFEGAIHIHWERLKRNLLSISLMAIAGIIVGTLLVSQFLIAFLDIPPSAAFAFGVLISATESVAVVAFFRRLSVNKRLANLVEGESLFNNGLAITIFNLALVAGAATATNTNEQAGLSFNLADLGAFLVVSIGGLAVGFIVSIVANYTIFRLINNRLIETALTIGLAFGTFLIAEQIQVAENLHMSGVLAVMAAGIYFGNTTPQYMRPSTRLVVNSFWEFLSFAATSILFLLMGLNIDIRELILTQTIRSVAIAVVAVWFSRALVVYGASWLSRWFDTSIPVAFRHVIFWGGLRGGMSLALVLTLSPTQFSEEHFGIVNQLRLMTFGVVLFTLLTQGITTSQLLQRLGLFHKSTYPVESQRRLGQFRIVRHGQQKIYHLYERRISSGDIWAPPDTYRDMVTRYRNEVQELLRQYANLKPQMIVQARRTALLAERAALLDALRQDLFSEQALYKLLEDIDDRLAAWHIIEKNLDDLL